MKLGIFKDPVEAYNQAPHLRASVVKEMEKSPGHYYAALTAKQKTTKYFDEGTVVHDVVLEQNTDRFIVVPEDAPKKPSSSQVNAKKPSEETVKAIAWWDHFSNSNRGKIVIDQELRDSLDLRLNTFVNSEAAINIYEGSQIEQSHYAQDPETGLYLKARPDMSKPGVIADFKTTKFMPGFVRDIWNNRYFIQVGFYSLVMELTTGSEFNSFYFIAQEKSPPYGVRVYSLDHSTVDFCKGKARELLNRVAVCTQDNCFPIYDDLIQSVSIPAWILSNEISFEEVG